MKHILYTRMLISYWIGQFRRKARSRFCLAKFLSLFCLDLNCVFTRSDWEEFQLNLFLITVLFWFRWDLLILVTFCLKIFAHRFQGLVSGCRVTAGFKVTGRSPLNLAVRGPVNMNSAPVVLRGACPSRGNTDGTSCVQRQDCDVRRKERGRMACSLRQLPLPSLSCELSGTWDSYLRGDWAVKNKQFVF